MEEAAGVWANSSIRSRSSSSVDFPERADARQVVCVCVTDNICTTQYYNIDNYLFYIVQ